mmetsp:Transcript_22610/g.56160  ORF Transcript_22610/g.56160 Transcript_22610/m.56160 type:complete len:200 (-) Transcript_22610:674-1273(-)
MTLFACRAGDFTFSASLSSISCGVLFSRAMADRTTSVCRSGSFTITSAPETFTSLALSPLFFRDHRASSAANCCISSARSSRSCCNSFSLFFHASLASRISTHACATRSFCSVVMFCALASETRFELPAEASHALRAACTSSTTSSDPSSSPSPAARRSSPGTSSASSTSGAERLSSGIARTSSDCRALLSSGTAFIWE